jgi:hypothetical protein
VGAEVSVGGPEYNLGTITYRVEKWEMEQVRGAISVLMELVS